MIPLGQEVRVSSWLPTPWIFRCYQSQVARPRLFLSTSSVSLQFSEGGTGPRRLINLSKVTLSIAWPRPSYLGGNPAQPKAQANPSAPISHTSMEKAGASPRCPGGAGRRARATFHSPSLLPLLAVARPSVFSGQYGDTKGLNGEKHACDDLLCPSIPALEQEGNAATAQLGMGAHTIIPALGRQRPEDCWEFVTNLDYRVRSYLTRADPVSARPSWKKSTD